MKYMNPNNILTTAVLNKYNVQKRVSVFFLLSILMLMSFQLFAHKGATGVIKQRMDMMDDIGDNMKGMKSMVQRKEPFDAVKMAMHAESIRKASMHIKKVFPEGSVNPPSEALPAIWQNWGKFSSQSDQLTIEAEKLRDIAESGDQRKVMKQFARVGKTCRSCHTDFRKKKDKK